MLQGHREKAEGHIITLELQVYAIESANINRETLGAMEQASVAMGKIHGKLTPEKVDQIMCEITLPLLLLRVFHLTIVNREKLREQNALSDEIVEAMNGINTDNEGNDVGLEAELEDLQQQQLDEQMLNISVPTTIEDVSPVANRERKSSLFHIPVQYAIANVPI